MLRRSTTHLWSTTRWKTQRKRFQKADARLHPELRVFRARAELRQAGGELRVADTVAERDAAGCSSGRSA
jgi:hypothetical protein